MDAAGASLSLVGRGWLASGSSWSQRGSEGLAQGPSPSHATAWPWEPRGVPSGSFSLFICKAGPC